jgi:BlaI family transcriptional regulator, penicillinase repressor
MVNVCEVWHSFVRKLSYLHVMKAKRQPQQERPEPTKSELEILQVLWEHGPSTVRFVNDTLNEQKREVQYTSTLKLMQIMVDKGLLLRDESSMKHVYSAAEEEGKTKSLLLNKFVDTLYNGSVSSLMMQLLGNKKTSKKELDAIKEMIKKMDKDAH